LRLKKYHSLGPTDAAAGQQKKRITTYVKRSEKAIVVKKSRLIIWITPHP